MTGDSDLDKLPHSIKILILDWDLTCCNFHLHSFLNKRGFSDYGSGETNAVTKEHLDKLFDFEEGDEDSPIKNPEQLKSVLKNAFNNKVKVAIASFTRYPKAVEYVVQNHLGLSKEQAESIKVVGGMDQSFELSDSKIRKNLHILYLLKAYKAKHGQLPQEVMLVDDSKENVDRVNDFHNNIGALLAQEKNISNILKNIDEEVAETTITKKELQSINFTGVQAPRGKITQIREKDKRKKHYGYLDEAEKWAGVEQNVHYEKLKGSIDDGVERGRTVKFAEEAQVQYIPLEGQEGAFAEKQRRKEEKKARCKQGSSNVCTPHTPIKASTKTDNGGDGRKNSGNQKPQPWKKGLVIIAPLVIGLIIFGSLVKALSLSLSLPAVGIGVVIVALTVVVYVLEELLLKPELKPNSVLKELGEKAKNLFAKEEKTQVVQ